MVANGNESLVYTLAEGRPLPHNNTTSQLRNNFGGGLSLLQDTQLIEILAHFSRERIPERVVHAKAAGALGYFELTHDVSDLTSAAFLTGPIGKRTELLARISTVGPERGSADTVRDFRGWALKFKTEEGNQDWVFNNHPVFFVRDPIKFPSLNRSHKRHPTTNASDADMFWDFHINNQESIHALMFLFSDRGLPANLRQINGYSGHTYTLTKPDGAYKYIKIHLKSDQGIQGLTNEEAAPLAGTRPDMHALDLRDAIDAGNYPSWTVYFQVVDPKDLESCPVNIFDMTKILPHSLFPLRQVGKIVYNKNPANYFVDIEQAAFSPSNMVPGFEPSEDPMLQARMFAYPDAARYRLGVNYQFLPTNASKVPVYNPTQRDGLMNFTANYGGDPNYVGTKIKPVTFKRFNEENTAKESEKEKGVDLQWAPRVTPFFTTEVTDADFEQARKLWEVMSKQQGAQDRFVDNVVAHVSECKEDWIKQGVFGKFNFLSSRFSPGFSSLLRPYG